MVFVLKLTTRLFSYIPVVDFTKLFHFMCNILLQNVMLTGFPTVLPELKLLPSYQPTRPISYAFAYSNLLLLVTICKRLVFSIPQRDTEGRYGKRC